MTRVHHSRDTQTEFVTLVDERGNLRAVADEMGIKYRTGLNIYRRIKERGHSETASRSGRPRKVDERGERQLARAGAKERRPPFRELGNIMQPRVSPSTVGRILDKVGLHRRVARQKPYISDKNVQKRKDWAEDHKAFRESDWRRVIWTDEVLFKPGERKGRVWVTRRVGEEYDPDCVVPTFKGGDLKVMCWGAITWEAKGPLVFLKYEGGKGGGINLQKYIDQVLDPYVLMYYTQHELENRWAYFQQDNAPPHVKKETRDWFRDHGITLLDHPPSSPDLNPIEHIWSIMKAKLRDRVRQPTSQEELRTVLKEIWDDITIEEVRKQTHSMESRCDAVIKAKGKHTRY